MSERTLLDLMREAEELRIRLACLEALIKRREHELWREHQAERARMIEAIGHPPSLAVTLGLVSPPL